MSLKKFLLEYVEKRIVLGLFTIDDTMKMSIIHLSRARSVTRLNLFTAALGKLESAMHDELIP